MRRHLALTGASLFVVAFLIALGSCGGSSSTPSSPDDPGGTNPPPTGPQTHTVTANPNNTFSPANLTINAGDSVTFTNNGGNHNVTADDGSFRCANGCDGQGGNGNPSTNAWSFTLTFNDPGNVPYNCETHVGLGMRGTIVVQ